MSFDFRIEKGDFRIGPDGDIAKVENTAKLRQEILKMVITPAGANPQFPWYGSLISASLVGSPFDMDFNVSFAENHLRNSLETLQRLQQEQTKVQRVTPFEQLAAISGISIQRNRIDPRFFHVDIRCLTRALSEIETGFSVNSLL